MSKGYYAIRLVVLHNLDDRKEYLLTHPSSLPITRKEALSFYKKMQSPQIINNVMCGSCRQFHSPNKIYEEKNESCL